MQKYYTIKIPVTESDIQDLQAGESFDWTFETNEDPTISINVQLVPEEYEDEDEDE